MNEEKFGNSSRKKKVKRIITYLGLFIVAMIPSLILISYSYYTNDSSNLVVEGKALVSNADIKLKVYMQDRDENGTPIVGSYSRIYFIPQTSYAYDESKTSCTDGVSIDSFDNYNFTITASQKGTCAVYFTALETENIVSSPNGTFRIFVEKTLGEKDYVEVGEIPTHNTYVVNESKTGETCSNVSISGSEVRVTTSSDTTCLIYLDLAS